MTDQPAPGAVPAHMLGRAPSAPSADRLTEIRDLLRKARDGTQSVADLEARLTEEKAALENLLTVTLPDAMTAVSMNSFGLEAEGNSPAYDAKIEPNIRANIAASWPPEKRAAGFQMLEALGGESLIKTVVTYEFGGKDRKAAKEFIERVFDSEGLEGVEALSVNHATLGSWLKSEVKADPPRVPTPAQLEAIGGFVGRKVKIKERKPK